MRLRIKHTVSPTASASEICDLILSEIAPSKDTARNNGDTALDIGQFLSPPHPDTYSLPDFGFARDYIDSALSHILALHPSRQKESGEAPGTSTIVIYSDYDADGITGGAILWETLHKLGFKVYPYIGDRIAEGYGFSHTGIDIVKEKYDPALIISVDHGISAREQVTYAAGLGIKVIVTDHHHRNEEKVPIDALAIFHIPSLSGSSTAYYVAKEIMLHIRNAQRKITDDDEKLFSVLRSLFTLDFVGIASIGTIADLVPLTGVSRSIAWHGLKALSASKRPGIRALKEVCGDIAMTVTPYEVGFMIAPRINASGRLDSALDALRLLCTSSTERASELALKLDTLNTKRQELVKAAVEEAMTIVEGMRDTAGDLPRILIVHQPFENLKLDIGDSTHVAWWHEGIIGLIASKLLEKHYRPTIVLTRTEGGWKASCRSVKDIHITDLLTQMKSYLLGYGGHAAAAGFTIATDKLPTFELALLAHAATSVSDTALERTLTVDIACTIDQASLKLAQALHALEPYGMGHPRPVFFSQGVISDTRVLGKDGKHLKFVVSHINPQHDTSFSTLRSQLEMLAFGKREEYRSIKIGDIVEIAYTLETNTWRDRTTPQGKVLYLKPIS